jgi:hypothetical protein
MDPFHIGSFSLGASGGLAANVAQELLVLDLELALDVCKFIPDVEAVFKVRKIRRFGGFCFLAGVLVGILILELYLKLFSGWMSIDAVHDYAPDKFGIQWH